VARLLGSLPSWQLGLIHFGDIWHCELGWDVDVYVLVRNIAADFESRFAYILKEKGALFVIVRGFGVGIALCMVVLKHAILQRIHVIPPHIGDAVLWHASVSSICCLKQMIEYFST